MLCSIFARRNFQFVSFISILENFDILKHFRVLFFKDRNMKFFRNILTFEREDKRCRKTSGSDYLFTRRRIPEEQNPQLHSWQNLRFRNHIILRASKICKRSEQAGSASDSSRTNTVPVKEKWFIPLYMWYMQPDSCSFFRYTVSLYLRHSVINGCI